MPTQVFSGDRPVVYLSIDWKDGTSGRVSRTATLKDLLAVVFPTVYGGLSSCKTMLMLLLAGHLL